MINNTRPITAYDFEILEFVRAKLKEAIEQRIKNKKNYTHHDTK